MSFEQEPLWKWFLLFVIFFTAAAASAWMIKAL